MTELRDTYKRSHDELTKLSIDRTYLDKQKTAQAEKEKELAHQEEIGKLRIQCAQEKADLAVSLFNTALRNVDIVRNKVANMPLVKVTEYSDGNKYTSIENQPSNVTETESHQ